MKVKLLLGVVILIAGIVAAVMGIAGVDRSDDLRDTPAIAREQNVPGPGDQNQPARQQATSMVLPVLAGLAIAAGAALIGIGMGNFRRPKIVPPESPQEHKAATTRGTTP
jgi:hypothetical protein